MLNTITEITFKRKEEGNIKVTPIVYCLESPYSLFSNCSDKPVLFVTACDEYGNYIGDMVFRWDNIECIRDIKPKEKSKK